ncbi:MAG TPA: SpoIID/LytB domain-containing protein, partial [Pyrinomonadaceae bacterium]|nr:SpoIID/LytB domain-containing protein [Pyrinomonadaceae bacterium]
MGSRSFSLNPSSPVIYLLTALSICVAILSIRNEPPKLESISFNETSATASDDEIDAGLQTAATEAIGSREGTVIVVDAQTGRVRAIVNPSLAKGQAFPPGSTIKPFTALAGLSTHLIDEDSRLLCRGRFHREDFSLNCSHPKISAPFNASQALAYSCNFYFGELGERLRSSDFTNTLTSFGFGQPIGFGQGEATGKVPGGRLSAGDFLGEGDRLLVTPLQLISAYSALVNGGHLYAPQLARAAGFIPRERAKIDIEESHRAILIEGMRGAVEYGTASRSGLNQLPLKIIGKTGTATEVGGYRTNGWFVGFAANDNGEIASQPEAAKLAVLVFLKHSHGAECAEVSRKIFDEFARLGSSGDRGGRRVSVAANNRGPSQGSTAAPSQHDSSLQIRVHLVGQNLTQTVSLEDYVLGVLAAEASWETELEALKAQAIVTRTFALKNLKRHGSEGFDFCSTTHCQRFVSLDDAEHHPSDLMRRAVAETSGQILRDEQGHLIDAYFHAACGGMTARIDSLWGARVPEYLRGVRDVYCESMPHHSWTDTIPAAQIAYALQRDSRTDVGPNLNQIIITKRDATGRAELITIVGATRRTVRGWDFKLIVGRALGWNFIKSSRFEVARDGASFVFHGSGFGHGLGLCQEGAHVMAQRGMS